MQADDEGGLSERAILRATAALRLTAGLPALKLPASLLQSVCNKLASLAATAQMLGGSLVTPNVGALLASALTNALANLNAIVSGSATGNASVKASAAASAAAQAAAKLNVNGILSAAAKLQVAAVPNLQPLAASLSAAANLQLVTGTSMFSSSPCSSCVYSF